MNATTKKVNLSVIAAKNNWHLASVISDLQTEGISRRDAEAFASFIFNHHAEITDCEASDCVTHEQWKRLELNDDGPEVEWMVPVA